MVRVAPIVFLLVALCGCAGEAPYVEKDLLQYGLPITLQTPDSVRVKTMDWGLQRDVTLEGDEGYSMQIFSSLATTANLRRALSEYKEISRDNPYFSKFMQEDEDGFIFEIQLDSVQSYDFRHLKIQGDREYIFQMGLLGTFSLEQVQEMYQLAQAAK
ncbi:MAG: hypothetical protein KTR24_02550 [Saprospiraceae bacterium]|nr:hypothetical protein [Saprospiraceae bacterium]